MKTCPKCSKDKDETFFSLNKNRKDGRQVYCKECYRDINADTYKRLPKRRAKIRETNNVKRQEIRDFLLSYLSEKVCYVCGFDNILALDFHHRDRSNKEFSIAEAIRKGYSLEKVKAEVGKCDIICANCHRILEANINRSFKL